MFTVLRECWLKVLNTQLYGSFSAQSEHTVAVSIHWSLLTRATVWSVLSQGLKFKLSMSWKKSSPTKNRRIMTSTQSIFQNCACSYPLGNLLAICGMLHQFMCPESCSLGQHHGHRTANPLWECFSCPVQPPCLVSQVPAWAGAQLVTSLSHPSHQG